MLKGDSPHKRPLTLAVVLPAHDEARHIAAVIGELPSWVDRIIVVDDASTDDTLAICNGLPDARLRIVSLGRNVGVGGAMVAGYRVALDEGCDVVVKMDADGQMDVRELPALLHPIGLGMADYAKGNRFRRSGRPKDMPAHRWWGNVLLSFLTKVASGYWHVFDPQCGFTAITASSLRRLRLESLATDYFFENDMLIRLNVIDARVVDVSTASLYGEEVSGIKVGRIVWTFPFRLLRRSAWRFLKRHVVNDFGVVAVLALAGTVFTLFGLAFGAYHWAESAARGEPATAGTVMIAVVPLILGVQMLLQGLALEVQASPGAEETRRLARMEADPSLVWEADEAASTQDGAAGEPRDGAAGPDRVLAFTAGDRPGVTRERAE